MRIYRLTPHLMVPRLMRICLEDFINEHRPDIMAELLEDPVRLYLREIGQIKLLNSDEEFRLASIIEAMRLVSTFRRHPVRKGVLPAMGIYHSLVHGIDHLLETISAGCQAPAASNCPIFA